MKIFLKLIIVILAFSAFLFKSPNVFSAGKVTLFSYPNQAEILEGFTTYFTAEGLLSETDYYMKGNLGVSSPLMDGQTQNASNWLSYNAVWTDFPLFRTNNEGSASAHFVMRAKTGGQTGRSILKVSILKVGDSSDKKIDSNEGMINILPRPTPTVIPSSTPTPTLVNSPTPTVVTTNTSTPTNRPSATPSIRPTITPIPTLVNETVDHYEGTTTDTPLVLGQNVAVESSPTTAVSKTNIQSNLPKLFIGLGVIFLILSGGIFLSTNVKHKKNS